MYLLVKNFILNYFIIFNLFYLFHLHLFVIIYFDLNVFSMIRLLIFFFIIIIKFKNLYHFNLIRDELYLRRLSFMKFKLFILFYLLDLS